MAAMNTSTKLLLIEKLAADERQASYSARCHAGVLHVGDRLRCAMDPGGNRKAVDLLCVEIRLNERLMVSELHANYGGLVVLEGKDAGTLDSDWTLYGE
jgi:hypothetical protein